MLVVLIDHVGQLKFLLSACDESSHECLFNGKGKGGIIVPRSEALPCASMLEDFIDFRDFLKMIAVSKILRLIAPTCEIVLCKGNIIYKNIWSLSCIHELIFFLFFYISSQ
jgi:hypothetical protein